MVIGSNPARFGPKEQLLNNFKQVEFHTFVEAMVFEHSICIG